MGSASSKRDVEDNEAFVGPLPASPTPEINTVSRPTAQPQHRKPPPPDSDSANPLLRDDDAGHELVPGESGKDGEKDEGHEKEKGKEPGSARFVKVFELDSEGKWSDKGTGHAECVFVERKEAWCLVVRSEGEASVLLNSTIRCEVNYVRQQDTLLVWAEPTLEDLALSFQDAAGCQSLWEELEQIQRRMAADKHDIDQLPEASTGAGRRSSTPPDDMRQFSLPDPELSNLKKLDDVIYQAARSFVGRAALTKALESSEFLRKLLPVFEQSEDLEDLESLYALSSIVRSIFVLNEGPIYEHLLQDEIFPTVLGILEYDGDFPKVKAAHREHFEKSAKFKEIVPIHNNVIKAKITQTYRIQYLKDVALVRLLDDGTFSSLLSMIFYNQIEIISFVKNDSLFLRDLFGLLNSASTSDVQKKEAIFFVRELFAITKQLQSMNRILFIRNIEPEAFYRTLINHGLFTALCDMLSKGDLAIRTAVAAISAHIIDYDANIVRSLTQAQAKVPGQQPFLELLIDRLLIEKDAGLRSQYAEMIRVLLETAPLDASEGIVPHPPSGAGAVDGFLDLVYDKWIHKLMSPISDYHVEEIAPSPATAAPEDELTAEDRAALCSHVCDLLCFMIKQHNHRSKYLCLTSPLMVKVSTLLTAKQNYLRLSALRVLRVCVGTLDDFYVNQVLLKKGILKPIVNLFVEVKSKYNLLNSACLDLFEFITRENLKPLIAHLVANFKEQLVDVTYVQTCANLILKHEQNIHPPPAPDDEKTDGPTPRAPSDGWTKADGAEDAYFNEEDDDEDENKSLDPSAWYTHNPSTPPTRNTTPPKTRQVDTPTPKASTRGTIEFVRASPDLRIGKPLVDYPIDDDEDDDDNIIATLVTRSKPASTSEKSVPTVTTSAESPIPMTGVKTNPSTESPTPMTGVKSNLSPSPSPSPSPPARRKFSFSFGKGAGAKPTEKRPRVEDEVDGDIDTAAASPPPAKRGVLADTAETHNKNGNGVEGPLSAEPEPPDQTDVNVTDDEDSSKPSKAR
ncbi:Platinum sensitivity protein [Thoreauomyces humboldtii]|nr:Platinum sensitivity protein [Thoreauomyces humboldtii]